MNQDPFYAGWKFVTWKFVTWMVFAVIWMVFVCCAFIAGCYIVDRTMDTVDQICGPITTMEVLVDE